MAVRRQKGSVGLGGCRARHLVSDVFVRGRPAPPISCVADVRAVVHVDDFTFAGTEGASEDTLMV